MGLLHLVGIGARAKRDGTDKRVEMLRLNKTKRGFSHVRKRGAGIPELLTQNRVGSKTVNSLHSLKVTEHITHKPGMLAKPNLSSDTSTGYQSECWERLKA